MTGVQTCALPIYSNYALINNRALYIKPISGEEAEDAAAEQKVACKETADTAADANTAFESGQA